MNRAISLTIAMLLALGLASCETPYTERSAFGTWLLGGVHAERVDQTTAKIVGRGNAYTSQSTIGNYIMLCAAEETLKDGYRYFTVVAGNDRTQYEAMPGFIAFSRNTAIYSPPAVSQFPGAAAVISMSNQALPGSHDAEQTRRYVGALVR